MKKSMFLLGLLLLIAVPSLCSQNLPVWHPNGLSLHLSTNGYLVPIVANYERYIHKEHIHWGLGTGLILAPPTSGKFPPNLAGQLTLSMWTGQKNHHFEAKVGILAGRIQSDFFYTNAIGVFSLGYRYQKPGEPFFFRADLGVGGIGVGVGTTF